MTPQQHWAPWLFAGAGVLLALTLIVQLVIYLRATPFGQEQRLLRLRIQSEPFLRKPRKPPRISQGSVIRSVPER